MRRRNIVLVAVLILLGAGVLAAWSVIRRGFSAHGDPSALEKIVARAARGLAVPASYKGLKNPYPATPENIRAGLEHFAGHCALCHANDGSGDTQFGRNMYPKPPDMRKTETQGLTDGEIYHTVQNGIRLSGMPAFGEQPQIDNTETWKLVLFIRHLPRLTPKEKKEMERFNPKSAAERAEEQEEEGFLRRENSGKVKKQHH